jgi:hypothetical protein
MVGLISEKVPDTFLSAFMKDMNQVLATIVRQFDRAPTPGGLQTWC